MSDEEFLISMKNRLLLLELERTGPAWWLWLKRNLLLVTNDVTLTGFEAERLLTLSGGPADAVDSLSVNAFYSLGFEQYQELVFRAETSMIPARA